METSDKKMEALLLAMAPIRAMLCKHNASIRNTKTCNGYERLYDNMMRKVTSAVYERITDAITDTNSKNTYFLRLAAARYKWLSEISDSCETATNSANTENKDSQYKMHLNLIHSKVANLLELELTSLNEKKPRKSKRTLLGKLPSDWREQLCKRMQNSKYWSAALIAATCGCRPSELVAGINIEQLKIAGEKFLIFRIKGSKVKNGQGQAVRKILFPLKNAPSLISTLAEQVSENSSAVTIQIESAKNFTVAITRTAAEIWPKIPGVSAYCLRHQSASDFKSSSLTVEQVAAALGHASTRTQKFYGQRQQSKNGITMAPLHVKGSQEVRTRPVFIKRSVSNSEPSP